MARVVEKIEIGKILEAVDVVDQKASDLFESIEHDQNDSIEDFDSQNHEIENLKPSILEISNKAYRNADESPVKPSSASLETIKDSTQNNIPNENTNNFPETSNNFSSLFSQNLDSKLTETLKEFCKNYIEDLYVGCP